MFFFSEFLKTLKSSSEALDRLYGADRWGVIEAVFNNAFQNITCKQQKGSRANYRIPTCSRIDFQTTFWDEFYTILT